MLDGGVGGQLHKWGHMAARFVGHPSYVGTSSLGNMLSALRCVCEPSWVAVERPLTLGNLAQSHDFTEPSPNKT